MQERKENVYIDLFHNKGCHKYFNHYFTGLGDDVHGVIGGKKLWS